MKKRQLSRSDREDRIKELTGLLEEGIRDVFASGKYQEYLKAMERFHRYSAANNILICKQKPDATYVAGYKTWQVLGRQVRKGETGILIFAPCPYKTKQMVDAIDEKTGTVKRDAAGKPMKEEREISYAYFKAATVFDISQTEGKPLPELAKELEEEVPGYDAMMEAVKKAALVPIRFESWEGTEKGHYDYGEGEIVIKEGMSELQTIKTGIHETVHSILHEDQEHLKDRRTMEVEAESTAFVVCNHFGLDTSEYSFGYLAGWSSNKELPELQKSLEVIQKTSHRLIEELEESLKRNTNVIDFARERMNQEIEIPSLTDTKTRRRRS